MNRRLRDKLDEDMVATTTKTAMNSSINEEEAGRNTLLIFVCIKKFVMFSGSYEHKVVDSRVLKF